MLFDVTLERARAGDRLARRAGLTLHPLAAPIPDAPATIPAAVRLAAERFTEIEAVVGVDQRLTYGQLRNRVDRAAQALVDLGVHPLDRVGASLSNCAEIVVAFLAVQRLGAIWVGVNKALAAPERRYILGHAEASLYLVDDDQLRDDALDGSTVATLRKVVVASAGSEDSEWHARVESAHALDEDWPTPLPHLPAAIAYTSGTTGFPKGAVHSQHNMLVPAVVQRDLNVTPGCRIGQALPLTILNIMIVGPVTALVAGATTVAVDRNSARGIVDWSRRERLDRFLVAPPAIHDLVTSDEFSAGDLAGVSRPGGGGAGVSDELRSAFQEKFGKRPRVAYGMTEAPTAVVSEPEYGRLPAGSCGVVNPHVEITVRDEGGDIVPDGELGELCVAGATAGPWANVYAPMLGYWKQPEATESVLGEGFYRTGDLGRIDGAGCCWVEGRRSEMILRGGTNVFPAEVERVIAMHPGVRAAAVIGRPDERLGEEIVAVVEPNDGDSIDVDDLRQLCATNLSRYKVPAEFVVVESLPRNQMDKVSRRALGELVATQSRIES